jgi:hypothetical protein
MIGSLKIHPCKTKIKIICKYFSNIWTKLLWNYLEKGWEQKDLNYFDHFTRARSLFALVKPKNLKNDPTVLQTTVWKGQFKKFAQTPINSLVDGKLYVSKDA